MSEKEGNARPLPKFGEWDVNNPKSADSFTYIFNKARDQKNNGAVGNGNGMEEKHKGNKDNPTPNHQSRRVFCCFYGE